MNSLGTVLRRQIREQGAPIAWSGLLVLVNAAIATTPPILVGRIVDALTRSDRSLLLALVLTYVALVPLSSFSNALEFYVVARFSATIGKQVRLRIAEALVAGKPAAVRAFSMGEIVNRIGGDIDQVVSTINASILPSISGIVAIVAATGAMLYLDGRLALVSFGTVVLSSVTMIPGRRLLVRVHRTQRSADDAFAAVLTERLNFPAILRAKSLSLLRQVVSMVGRANDDVIAASLRSVLVAQAVSSLTGFCSSLGPAAILLFGGYLVASHQATVGVIVTFLAFHGRLAGGFGQLNSLQNQLAVVRVAFERIDGLLRVERERGGTLPFVPGDIEFHDVGVSYGSAPLIRGFSGFIRDGVCTAIVGESGSGKSTLAALIARLLEPTVGSVSIGGVDLSAVGLDDLRRSVILVPPEPAISTGTLREIVGDVPWESVERALDLVELGDSTRLAPDTRIGANAFSQLSAGELQRLSLVAAIVRAPAVLVLDEATSAVDEAMESRILARLRERVRTLIVVTHRSSTLSSADRVLRVSAGCVEELPPPPLLARS